MLVVVTAGMIAGEGMAGIMQAALGVANIAQGGAGVWPLGDGFRVACSGGVCIGPLAAQIPVTCLTSVHGSQGSMTRCVPNAPMWKACVCLRVHVHVCA